MERIEQLTAIPMLSEDGIHVWGARVSEFADVLDRLSEPLSVEERAKAARFHREEDRAASIVARGALRVLLAVYAGGTPSGIDFSYCENGKPRLASSDKDGEGVTFNLSHSGDWVVLAFGLNRMIGLDLEQIRGNLNLAGIAKRYFSAEERERIEVAEDRSRAFFHHWARKEAYVKAAGSTLFRELSSFAVPEADGEKDGWFFHRLEAGSRYAAAVVSNRPIAALPCYDFRALDWGA